MQRLIRYFFFYLIHSKTRQKLLLLACLGLCLSSFSLLVIQSIMGGLQNGLINRSKNIHGTLLIKLNLSHPQFENQLLSLYKFLDSKNVKFTKEFEQEVILKHDSFVTPAIIRGIDFDFYSPDFLNNKDVGDLVIGSDLATKLNAYSGSEIKIMSPSQLDYMIGLLPRAVTSHLSDYFTSELSEVDSFYSWSRIGLMQNLMRSNFPNSLRIYSIEKNLIQDLKIFDKNFIKLITWNDQNSSLVKALNLETTVMYFLFISMTCLVAVSIISGFLIFYSKVKKDLLSFWILGLPYNQIKKLLIRFNISISLISSFAGLVIGLCSLLILDRVSLDFMPDVFVERKLPIHLSYFSIITAFLIPCTISLIFSSLGLKFFLKESDSLVKQIRSLS